MERNIKEGTWFDVNTKEEFESLKKYGKISFTYISWPARVQKGHWRGPGKYLLLSYSQRCPKNCCDDNVHELVSKEEVIKEISEEMRILAHLLKEIRGK